VRQRTDGFARMYEAALREDRQHAGAALRLGNLRAGLGQERQDFILVDQGVRQDIETIAIEDIPVSMMLALDVSESVAGQKLRALVDGVKAAASALGPRDLSALLTLSEEIKLRTPCLPAAPQSSRPDDLVVQSLMIAFAVVTTSCIAVRKCRSPSGITRFRHSSLILWTLNSSAKSMWPR
jgi:hypothetical protein